MKSDVYRVLCETDGHYTIVLGSSQLFESYNVLSEPDTVVVGEGWWGGVVGRGYTGIRIGGGGSWAYKGRRG